MEQLVLSYRDGEWMELAPDAVGVDATVVIEPHGRWRWRVGRRSGLSMSELEARTDAETALAEAVMGAL